jgi:hypothetical protein
VADVLGTTATNSKNVTSGTGSDSIVLTIPAGTANGSYNVRVTVSNSSGSGANQKNDQQNAAVIVALKRPIAVTADPQTKTYGDADPALTYKITSGSLASGDSFTGALTRDAGPAVGSYAIKQGTLKIVNASGVDVTANYIITYVGGNLVIEARKITVTTDAKTKTYGDTEPALTYQITSGSLVTGDSFTGALTRVAGENVGTYTIQQGTLALSSNYKLIYVGGNLSIMYAAAGGACYGSAGHQILQPIDADGSSVFKQNSTVPAKFRVCDANGISIGTPGVVSSFKLVQKVSGTAVDTVDEDVVSTTPDTTFCWSSTDQQWIFNMNTKNLLANYTYVYIVTLNDGSPIQFQFGLK